MQQTRDDDDTRSCFVLLKRSMISLRGCAAALPVDLHVLQVDPLRTVTVHVHAAISTAVEGEGETTCVARSLLQRNGRFHFYTPRLLDLPAHVPVPTGRNSNYLQVDRNVHVAS